MKQSSKAECQAFEMRKDISACLQDHHARPPVQKGFVVKGLRIELLWQVRNVPQSYQNALYIAKWPIKTTMLKLIWPDVFFENFEDCIHLSRIKSGHDLHIRGLVILREIVSFENSESLQSWKVDKYILQKTSMSQSFVRISELQHILGELLCLAYCLRAIFVVTVP